MSTSTKTAANAAWCKVCQGTLATIWLLLSGDPSENSCDWWAIYIAASLLHINIGLWFISSMGYYYRWYQLGQLYRSCMYVKECYNKCQSKYDCCSSGQPTVSGRQHSFLLHTFYWYLLMNVSNDSQNARAFLGQPAKQCMHCATMQV